MECLINYYRRRGEGSGIREHSVRNSVRFHAREPSCLDGDSTSGVRQRQAKTGSACTPTRFRQIQRRTHTSRHRAHPLSGREQGVGKTQQMEVLYLSYLRAQHSQLC